MPLLMTLYDIRVSAIYEGRPQLEPHFRSYSRNDELSFGCRPQTRHVFGRSKGSPSNA